MPHTISNAEKLQGIAEGDSPVVFISGATGVGTSTLAREVSRIVDALGVVGRDTLREILRTVGFVAPPNSESAKRPASLVSKALALSSFEAWQVFRNDRPLPGDNLRTGTPGGPTLDEITEGFFLQANAVFEAALAVAYRAMAERFPVIIEGVHIPLNRLESSWIWNRDRVFRVYLDCENEAKHRRHLEEDPKYEARERIKRERYLQEPSWGAIRHIRGLLNAAARDHNDVHVDSSEMKPKELAIRVGKAYFDWLLRVAQEHPLWPLSGNSCKASPSCCLTPPNCPPLGVTDSDVFSMKDSLIFHGTDSAS